MQESKQSQLIPVYLLSLFGLLCAPFSYAALKPLVVIDPGHGGADLGAVYEEGSFRVTEKELTLKLALELEQELKTLGFRTYLTRRKDSLLAVTDRTAMANRLGADIFVSIHMNSFVGQEDQAHGIETYILNHSSDATSKRLADLENAVLNGSKAALKVNETQPGASQDVSLILKDLMLSANQSKSLKLACEIQDAVLSATSNKKSRKKANRGVRQAMFYVLLGADMPSILLEAGFINSARDRNLIFNEDSRARIAQSLAQGIRSYQNQAQARTDPSKGMKLARTLSSCKVH